MYSKLYSMNMPGWNIQSQVPESCSINPRVIDETSNFDGKGDGEELERKKEKRKTEKRKEYQQWKFNVLSYTEYSKDTKMSRARTMNDFHFKL